MIIPIWLTKILPCDCSFRIQASCLLHLCLLSLSSVIIFHQVRLTYLEFTFWELFFESPIYDVSQSLPGNVFVYLESSSVRFYWFAKRVILNLDCLSITVTLTDWVKAFWSSFFYGFFLYKSHLMQMGVLFQTAITWIETFV